MTYTGSINLTKIGKAMREGTISTWTTKEGDIMANVALFTNDVPDQHGNDAAMKCQGIKDQPDPKVYAGNFKKAGQKAEPSPIGEQTDLPF